MDFLGVAHSDTPTDYLEILVSPDFSIYKSFVLDIPYCLHQSQAIGPQLGIQFRRNGVWQTAWNTMQTMILMYNTASGPANSPQAYSYIGNPSWDFIPLAFDNAEIDPGYGFRGQFVIHAPGQIGGAHRYMQLQGKSTFSQGPMCHDVYANMIFPDFDGIRLYFKFGPTQPGDQITGRMELYGIESPVHVPADPVDPPDPGDPPPSVSYEVAYGLVDNGSVTDRS